MGKRATREHRLRDWAASHDKRNVLLSHDGKRWSLILIGQRHNGRRSNVGVQCERLDDAIDRALEQWEADRG